MTITPNLKIGDRVMRVLAGTVQMVVVVKKIEEDSIVCTVPEEEIENAIVRINTVAEVFGEEKVNEEQIREQLEWTFHKGTGMEIDKLLGWDGITCSGSYITAIFASN